MIGHCGLNALSISKNHHIVPQCAQRRFAVGNGGLISRYDKVTGEFKTVPIRQSLTIENYNTAIVNGQLDVSHEDSYHKYERHYPKYVNEVIAFANDITGKDHNDLITNMSKRRQSYPYQIDQFAARSMVTHPLARDQHSKIFVDFTPDLNYYGRKSFFDVETINVFREVLNIGGVQAVIIRRTGGIPFSIGMQWAIPFPSPHKILAFPLTPDLCILYCLDRPAIIDHPTVTDSDTFGLSILEARFRSRDRYIFGINSVDWPQSNERVSLLERAQRLWRETNLTLGQAEDIQWDLSGEELGPMV